MKTRNNDNFGEVGLGAWQIGADWGTLDDDQAYELLDTAKRMGIRFIDTADVYGAGLSELRIGNFLKENSQERFFIATKLGRLHGFPDQYSLELFRTCIDDSCARLGVDCLDLVQLHCVPTEVLAKGDVFEWLRILKAEGKIRHFGASIESTEEARICLAQEGLYSLQVIYNIFRQHPISAILDEAKEKGVSIIVRLPLASGLLSGKFHSGTEFSIEDHRHYNREGNAFHVGETFSGIPFEIGLQLVEKCKEIVQEEELPLSLVALRWVLDHPAVTVVIPGATKIEHVIQNAQATYLSPLSASLHEDLRRFYFDHVQEHIRGRI